jgi:hypothetical protein
MDEASWRSVEPGDEPRWFAAIEALDATEGRPTPCPSCAGADLRAFYVRFPNPAEDHGRGGFWIWCPACRRFMHTSGSVPGWWVDVPGVDLRDLTPEPVWPDSHWAKIVQAQG